MINSGFIMLKRDLINWEWYSDVNTSQLFLHCLLKVNYSEKKWQGITINKGEFITSYEKIAVETGLTVSKVRTSLHKLKKTNYLVMETTKSYTKIIIPRLSEFVVKIKQTELDKQNNIQNNKQVAYKSQTDDNQVAITNTNNKLLINRKEIFREDVYALSKFKFKDLDSFFNYWTELNKEKTEMRFEEHKYFEIEKRLEKWVKNEKKISSVSNSEKKLLKNR